MKSKVALLLSIAVLFMSVERGIDFACATDLEPDHHADFQGSTSTDPVPGETDHDPALPDCSHCMHGHLAGIIDSEPALNVVMLGRTLPSARSTLIDQLQEPPTPPPNI